MHLSLGLCCFAVYLKRRGNMSAVTLKQISRWIGGSLGLIGLAFFAFKLNQYSDQIAFKQFGLGSWILLLILIIAYGFSGIFLALAWHNLLQYFGVQVYQRWAIWAYGLSQLAKYMPGNIFHLAGRQAIGVGSGVANWPLLKSTLWELGTIAITGSLFSILILPLIIPSLHDYFTILFFFTVLSAVLLISSRIFSALVAWAITKYALFLTLSSLVFIVVLTLVSTPNNDFWLNMPTICGAYVIAWLAGLVTPGAPAGVGIREVVMYALLHTLVSQSDLITAIVLARVVTMGGDLFFYLLALLFFKPEAVVADG